MNVRRLKTIARMILKYPEAYDQNTFGHAAGFRKGVPACGTAHCIGGMAAGRYANSRWKRECYTPVALIAAETLGLDVYQADRLFSVACDHPSAWGGFGLAYNKAKTAKGRARVAYKRIMEFIRTDGAV